MRKAWEESKDQPLTDSQQGNRTCPKKPESSQQPDEPGSRSIPRTSKQECRPTDALVLAIQTLSRAPAELRCTQTSDLQNYEAIWLLFQVSESVVIAHGNNRKLIQGMRQRAEGVGEEYPMKTEQGEPSPKVRSTWSVRRTACGQCGQSGESKETCSRR